MPAVPHLNDPIAVVRAYEAACNAGDLDAAVACFAGDGVIEDALGRRCQGPAALRAAHEYDLTARATVAFSDCMADGATVTCRILHTTALDRAVGLDGWRSRAVFTIEQGRIATFVSLPSEPAERERHRQAKAAVQQWAQQHYPDDFARSHGFDGAAGAALTRLAEAWTRR